MMYQNASCPHWNKKLGGEEIPSERAGYAPDPLVNPTEHTAADTIPISNR